jgi:integrase
MARKHRKRGMGSIFKHGPSWWIGYYVDGRLFRERIGPIGLVTKGQAEQALKARLGEVVQGRFNLEKLKKTIPLSKLVEKYLQWIKENQKGFERESGITEFFLIFIGDRGINEIASWNIDQYKSERRKDGVKPATINRELTVLRSMFNRAIEWGDMTANPVNGVKKAKPLKADEYERESKYVPNEVFAQIVKAASPQLSAFITIARHTGMRLGEILKLVRNDVDDEKEQIYVRDTKNFSQRAVPVNAVARKALPTLPQERERFFIYKNRHAVESAWRHALEKARISGFRIHDLRHSFITDMVTKGVDITTVMEITGHRDIRMLKRYSHPTQEHNKQAVKLLETIPGIHTTFTQGVKLADISKNAKEL